jgi:hypothetical protein
MQLGLNLGLELRTLADCFLSCVVANRFIDGHICSPFWLHSSRRGTEPRYKRSFLKSWKLTDHG